MAATSNQKMKFKRLGNSGLRVSEICLGAMNFGSKTDEENSFKIMDKFAELGGNFIDVADIYGYPNFGQSERILGKWLSTKKREDWIIATKFRFNVGSGPNDYGASRKHLLDAVESSLKNLQTSYVDLYQVHGYDKETPLEETLRSLNDLVRSGKVRYIGVSNYRGYQLMKAHYLCKELHLEPYICLQPEYNLLCREIEWEILEVAREIGLGVIPWSPLKGGWLTGKYTKEMEAPPEGTRVDVATKSGFSETSWAQATDYTWKVLDVVKEVAAKLGKTPSQVSLRWLMQKPWVTAPIVGPRTIEQAEDNLHIFDFVISDEDMKKLDEVSKPPRIPYPYNWESTSNYKF